MGRAWSGRGREDVVGEVLIQQLYQEHGASLLAYAERLMGDRALAEDVFQKTLLRAWKNPDVLTNNKGSVRGWLLTIARNIAFDRHRARASRAAEAAEVGLSVAATPVTRDQAGGLVESMTLSGAMEQLKPEHRDVIRAVYFQGMRVDEAAHSLGIAAGTVKSRTYHALRRLRHVLPEAPAPVTPKVAAGQATAEVADEEMAGSGHETELLGAYVLGVLDAGEQTTVRDHLAGCPECQQDADELREVEAALGELPAEALIEGPPVDGDLLLRRTLRGLHAEQSARTRTRRGGWIAAAAAVAAVALAGGIQVGRGATPRSAPIALPTASAATASPAGNQVVASATDAATGASMRVTLQPAVGWVRLNVTVTGVPANTECRLAVYGADGTRREAGSWLVSPQGEATGTTLSGSAQIAPANVSRVQVETSSGQTLVSVPV